MTAELLLLLLLNDWLDDDREECTAAVLLLDGDVLLLEKSCTNGGEEAERAGDVSCKSVWCLPLHVWHDIRFLQSEMKFPGTRQL